MCGTHESKVYFSQVKRFDNHRNRIESQIQGKVEFLSVR
jgi:hypothetical protein